MDIITLTLSPAFDVHAYCEDFKAGRENHVKLLSRDAGGKGLNISRALYEYGIVSEAVILLGDEGGDEFERAVQNLNIPIHSAYTHGRIRENLTVHSKDGETRVSFEGFCTDFSVIDEIDKAISLKEGDVLTVTGSIPSGIDIERLKKYLLKLKSRGIRIVIDSRSFSLSDIKDVGPWLIKPNGEEISAYLGCEIKDFGMLVGFADEIGAFGAEIVIISLGELGAMLFEDGNILTAKPPKIYTVSTIGAGDSMIGGFIAGLAEGLSKKEAFALSVAFGTAACLTEGSRPPRKKDISDVIKKIKIYKGN